MWLGPYIVSKVLNKGAYELIDFDGNKLAEPRNGLYQKLIEDKQYWEGRICNVPNFALGHNG